MRKASRVKGGAGFHSPTQTKSGALRTVQDGCPSHSFSTRVAYIARGGSRTEALDPPQASKPSLPRTHAVHLLLSADQAAMLLDPDGTVPTLCRKERNAFRSFFYLKCPCARATLCALPVKRGSEAWLEKRRKKRSLRPWLTESHRV